MHLIDRAEVIPVKEKNVKHLTKTLAVVSLLIPMSAQPLGVGDIELHSSLNQKLNAEIHLRLAAGENPADVTVKLAPPEKFDQAGVPWNYFLSKIKFNPVVQADGSIIVKVTSREPLTEPFLDFLLEVSWPQGSQFREFTVLIDPPAAYRAPVIPSATGSDYRVEQLEDYAEPVRKSQPARASVRRVDAAANITPQTPTSGEYGPIQTADTLWRIANQLGSERGVPTNQMMAALFRANPEAFNRGNIDSLKTGMVLKIPETDAILQSTGKRSDAKPARKPAKPATETVANNKALELVAPTDAKVTENATPTGQLKPGQPDGESRASAEGAASGTADGKDLDLQSRIDRLEQQLNMMQQLLALKDQQLATLQHNGQEAAQQTGESAQSLPAQPPEATPAPAEPVAPVQPAVPTPAAEPPVAVAPPETPPEIKPAPAPAPTVPKPVRPTAPPPAPVIEEESFLSSPSYSLAIGGLSVGIMGLLGWLLWRKRKIESQTNTESMFASASQIRMPDADSNLAVPVMDINSTGAYDVGTVGESSFISDFTPSDFEAFDTDQSDIDPMSEADVYLAYGRYQQAEDLIRHAIKDQPEKDDYKLKLLEIFYANENKERFAEYTQELADAGKNTDRPFWNKVSDMAKEIIPESALFGGATTQQKSTHASDTSVQAIDTMDSEPARFEAVDDFDFHSPTSNDDLNDLKTPALPDMELMDEINSELAEMQLTLPEESDHSSLDFDLGSFNKPESKAEPKQEIIDQTPDIESIDFDLSSFGTETADEEKPAASETLESFDFNFDLDAAPAPDNGASSKKAVEEEPLDLASLESFEFPEFGNDEPKKTPAQPAREPLSTGSDEFDFNFDFETPGSKSVDDDMDFGVADLTDMDEFETKIDLAKAYIDMGDAEAARSIATEVLAKGTPEQKQAAQAILDELT